MEPGDTDQDKQQAITPKATQDSDDRRGFWGAVREYRDAIALSLFALVPIAFIVRIVFWPQGSLHFTSSEQIALIRTNERLIQQTQWTIGAVLTLAVALAGFNWIQSSRNHDRDRSALREYQEFLSHQNDARFIQYERNIESLENRIKQLETKTTSEVSRINTELLQAKFDLWTARPHGSLSVLTRAMGYQEYAVAEVSGIVADGDEPSALLVRVCEHFQVLSSYKQRGVTRAYLQEVLGLVRNYFTDSADPETLRVAEVQNIDVHLADLSVYVKDFEPELHPLVDELNRIRQAIAASD